MTGPFVDPIDGGEIEVSKFWGPHVTRQLYGLPVPKPQRRRRWPIAVAFVAGVLFGLGAVPAAIIASDRNTGWD